MNARIEKSGTYKLGSRSVRRIGYGAMQLAGPGVFGPPNNPQVALAVLREAVDSGINHIDTSDFYGPHITNRLIREALSPYREDLVIVTKVGALRGTDGSWLPATSPQQLTQAVHDNLRNLGLDVLELVNFRCMLSVFGPAEGSIEEGVSTLAEIQSNGLIRHIGLSNVTATQVSQARQMAEIVCVQNHFNLAHRADDALVDLLLQDNIPYVPFFPLGGFTPLQSQTLSEVAARVEASPLQVALAWLLHRAPNILLIPGTSSLTHLHENIKAGELKLPPDAFNALDAIGRLKDPEVLGH